MAFSDETIQQVWQKARGLNDFPAAIWRKDECGAWIRRDDYGKKQSEFGWKIENISLGGPDEIENLRAFQHANGYDRANRRARCRVTADQTGMQVMERIREPRNREA